MAVIVYQCTTCNRQIELLENKFGFEVVGRCVITKNCKGTLNRVERKEANVLPKLPDPDPNGLEDWSQRKAYFKYAQTVRLTKWIVKHDLNTNPSVNIHIYTPDGVLEPIEAQIDYIDSNTLTATFDQPRTGIIECTARSTTSISAKPVTIATPDILLSGNAVLTLATLNPAQSMKFSFTFLNPTNFMQEQVIELDANSPDAYMSAWDSIQQVYINGRIYTTRTIIISDLLAPYGIQDLSPFYITWMGSDPTQYAAPKKDQAFFLLSDSPFTEVDRVLDKVVDLSVINQSTAPVLTYFKDSQFYIKGSAVKTIYPSIKIIKTV